MLTSANNAKTAVSGKNFIVVNVYLKARRPEYGSVTFMAVQAFAEWLLRLLEATVCLEEGYAEVEGPDRGSCGRITPMSNGREVTGFLLSTKMEPGLRDPFSNDLMPNRLAPGYGRYVPLGNRSIAELERLVRFTCNISDSAGELRVRNPEACAK